jgi:hypothetical protein
MESDTEYERQQEWIQTENRIEDENDLRRSKERQLSEAWLEGVETGDYSKMLAHVGFTGIGCVSDPPAPASKFATEVQRLRWELNSATRLKPEWCHSWQSMIGWLDLQNPEASLVILNRMLNELTFVSEHLRPRKQGIDLNAFAQLEFAREILKIRDRIHVLESELRAAQSQQL